MSTSPLPADDRVLPFQIEGADVRGRVVRLGPAVERAVGGHAYPEPVARLLGEAVALVAMMGSALKFDGVLTLQASGDGPLRAIVADYERPAAEGNGGHTGKVRGIARCDAEAIAATDGSLAGMMGKGVLSLTLDPGGDMQRYQGVVELEGRTLSEAAARYLATSEQLPSLVRLAVGREMVAGGRETFRAGGIIVQRVAREGGNPRASAADDDQWERIGLFVGTIEDHELLDPGLAPEQLLWRLFHEEGVRVYQPHEVSFGCRCSEKRVALILSGFPPVSRLEMQDDAGVIRATCEFCNSAYAFTEADIAAVRPNLPDGGAV